MPDPPAVISEALPALRPGLVRVRALVSVTVGGGAYFAGDVFVAHESHVLPRLARDEVELV